MNFYVLSYFVEWEYFFCRFVQEKLGGPSISEYEKLQAEKADLQLKYDELLSAHQETCKLVLSQIFYIIWSCFLLALFCILYGQALFFA